MKRNLRLLPPLLAVLFTILACGMPDLPFFQTTPTPAGSIRPKFTNYRTPEFQIDIQAFSDAGCKPDPEGKLRCPPNLPPFDQVGCFEISAAPSILGGLTPAYPLMLCTIDANPGSEPTPDQYIYSVGCQEQTYFRLVIFKDGQPIAIKNRAELKAAFAPIDTPQEALSYAIAATGFSAYFGLKDENMRYITPTISDSYVENAQDGYVVHLYSYNECGCGPHATNTRRININRSGNVDIEDAHPAWEDPSKDDVCVD
jgi:hypothetical protein